MAQRAKLLRVTPAAATLPLQSIPATPHHHHTLLVPDERPSHADVVPATAVFVASKYASRAHASRRRKTHSLLLATLAYNVGPYRLLGSGKIPKSTLIRKLEAGDRNIYREYIAFCNYKGKRHAMLLKRRKAEFALLYVP